MVASLDGFIAKRDNSVSWFETTDHYEKGINAESDESFMETIDCFIMGSRTYEQAVELSKKFGWAYGEVPTIVLTKRNLPMQRKNVEFYSGDLNKLVTERLKGKYQNIWLAGGPAAAIDFIRLKLVDEIRLSIIPIILGDGVRFLEGLEQEYPLHLKDVTAYKNGIVELCYEIMKNPGPIAT